MLGRGGTAPVFRLQGPDRTYALKLLDKKFSEGALGLQTKVRIDQQIKLGNHGCNQLIVRFDGGSFESRLFLLMSCAEGQELEKRLQDIPRFKIRNIIDQIAQAALFLRSKGLSHRDIKSANIFISNDFDRATLLDLSVLREIHDPVGIGTDHGNQLPVVATSRYTPPEYLFRLQDPTPEFWHGVDIYQLGGVLHDLIMQEPMFSSEYAASSENRYRFAWIVATIDPKVRAADVDTDLVLLARRALDKNWERRRTLKLEDFLNNTEINTASLAAIGIISSSGPASIPASMPKPAEAKELARRVDEHILAFLGQKSLTATHAMEHGPSDLAMILIWQWRQHGGNVADSVELKANVEIVAADPTAKVSTVVEFHLTVDGSSKSAGLQLPDCEYQQNVDEEVARLIVGSLGTLAAAALRAAEGE